MNELSDADLLAYLDGNAPPDVAAQIEGSPAYRERMGALSQLENNLAAQLYRVQCPPPQWLGEYGLRLLPAGEMLLVRAHLAGCPHCRAELMSQQEFMAAGDDLAGRVRLTLGSLLSGMGPALPRPAPAAGQRGSEPVPLHFSAGDMEVLIEIQPQTDALEYRLMVGLVLGDVPPGAAVELFRQGERAGGAALDDLGNFRLEGLLPGSYDLVVVSPGEEVYLPAIVVW